MIHNHRDGPRRRMQASSAMLHSALLMTLPLLQACSAVAPTPTTASMQQPAHATLPKETAFAVAANASSPVGDEITARIVASVDGLALVDHHGLPSIRIATAHSTAVVSLFGGQLLSFTPEGGTDALWLSPDTLPPPQPTRGGSPVIWPYFSRQGQTDALPAHGLVRTLPWTLLEASRDQQGNIELLLAPPALDGLPLQLRMRLHVGRSLRQQLITTNISAAPVIFTEALHNYLRVGDVSRVQVEGVDGTVYRNKGEPYSMARAQHGALALAAFADSGIDRIYRRADGQYQLLDRSLQRRISLRTTGSNSLVTWNAGRGAETRSPDIGPGWRHYLCLETANVGQDVVTLAPGARHVMGQQISVEPL